MSGERIIMIKSIPLRMKSIVSLNGRFHSNLSLVRSAAQRTSDLAVFNPIPMALSPFSRFTGRFGRERKSLEQSLSILLAKDTPDKKDPNDEPSKDLGEKSGKKGEKKADEDKKDKEEESDTEDSDDNDDKGRLLIPLWKLFKF